MKIFKLILMISILISAQINAADENAADEIDTVKIKKYLTKNQKELEKMGLTLNEKLYSEKLYSEKLYSSPTPEDSFIKGYDGVPNNYYKMVNSIEVANEKIDCPNYDKNWAIAFNLNSRIKYLKKLYNADLTSEDLSSLTNNDLKYLNSLANLDFSENKVENPYAGIAASAADAVYAETVIRKKAEAIKACIPANLRAFFPLKRKFCPLGHRSNNLTDFNHSIKSTITPTKNEEAENPFKPEHLNELKPSVEPVD